MVEEENLQFHEEYMNEQDPSILHFLLASGDDVWIALHCCIVPFLPNSLNAFYLSRFPASNSVMT